MEKSEIIKLVVGLDSPSTGVWYDSYPSDVYNSPDGKVEIGGYFLDERDENNKRLLYLIITAGCETVTAGFKPFVRQTTPRSDGT